MSPDLLTSEVTPSLRYTAPLADTLEEGGETPTSSGGATETFYLLSALHCSLASFIHSLTKPFLSPCSVPGTVSKQSEEQTSKNSSCQ